MARSGTLTRGQAVVLRDSGQKAAKMDQRAWWSFLRPRRRLPRVGLALGGGGVRGLAHIGVLKVFEEEEVPVHLLAGTSAGGLVGASYAAGLTPDQLEEQALWLAKPQHLLAFVDRSLPRRGLLTGGKVSEYLAQWLQGVTFDGLRIPLALVAVDLVTGEKVVLQDGPVLEAVRATIALPGFFTPVERGEAVLVDGGLLDNLPADVVREMGADVVIAVDVSTDEQVMDFYVEQFRGRRLIPDGLVELVDVVWRSAMVMVREVNRRVLEEARPDVLICPEIPPSVTVLSGFNQAAEVIAAGERAARAALPRIGELLGQQYDQ